MQIKHFLISGKAKLVILALVVVLAASITTTTAQEPILNTAPFVSVDTLVVVLPIKATASDDGLPNPPGKLTYQWSFIEGPGPVSFVDAHALETFVVLSDYGTYRLRFTAFDGALSSFDDKLVHVVADSTIPPVEN